MLFLIRPAEQIARQVEGYDASIAVRESLAASHNPTDHQEDVVSSLALTGDNIISAKADRSPLEGGKRAFYCLLVNK